MDLKELLKFINWEHKRLIENFGKSSTEKERVLARTVKLTEELGELCDEVLAYNNNQRKEKMENHDRENLPSEFADVIITAFLLAKAMNIDVEKALASKVEKIRNRKYEQ